MVYPQLCLSCGASLSLPDENSCKACWAETTIFDGSEAACEKCGLPLGGVKTERIAHCWQCDGHKYDKARSIGIYSHALASAVISLKTVPNLKKQICEAFEAAFLRSDFDASTLIIPVPLSRQRFHERGFNQAEVVAKYLSERTQIPTDALSLARTKHSQIHRIGMDSKARDLSVQNAFKVVRPKLIEGQRILLIDDVYTTGATLSYCAKALKKSGALEVNALTLARAIIKH